MMHFLFPWRDSFAQDDMAEFEAPAFSKKRVVEAGDALRGHLHSVSPEAVQIFKIAHNWRASHVIPMRHLRAELAAKVRKMKGGAITAARMKRMRSIRKKLRSSPITLYQMQDIAGCRAILSNQDAVNKLLDSYRSQANHVLHREYDYISNPKAGGYRSHHLIFRYNGAGDFGSLNSNSLMVEVQLRTQLQHAWATAVEAVGMVRNEDLKGGQGNADWLRFFALMASEFATEEGAALVPNADASAPIRRTELIALEKGLNAFATLENYSRAVKVSEMSGRTVSPFFLIQFDPATQRVSVRGLSNTASVASLNSAEKNTQINSVLVEVDKAADLREAYPNYFLDVKIFTDRLRKIVRPRQARSFDGDWFKNWISGNRR